MTNPALNSVIVRVVPCDDEAYLPRAHGQLVHAWFLKVLSQCDPGLANRLHDLDSLKPFTLSMVSGGVYCKGGRSKFMKDGDHWIRITGFEPAFAGFLSELCAQKISLIRLGDSPFEVTDLIRDSAMHPLARQSDFEVLWADSLAEQQPARGLRLQFLSATAFKAGRQNIPLPLPKLIFQSLLAAWNATAPKSLSIRTEIEIHRSVWLSRYRLETETLRFRGYKEVGFTGECSFVVDERAPKEVTPLARLLLQFSFFAGIGYKTSMGMGQAQLLPVKK